MSSPPRSFFISARLLLVVLPLALDGCAIHSTPGRVGQHTLAGDGRLPAGDISVHFQPAKWLKISRLEYVAFVAMDAQVRSDGSLRILRVCESYPDSSRNRLAGSLGERARLDVATVGSHLDPRAKIFVVFFKPSVDGDLALIFAEQEGEPPPGMSRKAVYLETLYY